MKRKLIYLSVLLASFSCGEDFADTPNFGALDETTLANAQGVDLLLTGAYAVLDGVRTNGAATPFGISPDNWWFDVIADDAHKGSNDSDQQTLFDLETFNILTSNDYVLAKFQSLYAGVNRSNQVLAQIASIPDEDFSFQEAQARFLRAYFYFELTKIYGNVSIIDVENFASGEFNVPNSGPAWDIVESDLQFAIENLLPTPIAGEEGRPNIMTARALLGKAHVFQQEWNEALTQLNMVINSGQFSLNANFIDNFSAPAENNGPEAVFQIQFSNAGPNAPNGNQGGTLNFPGGGPANTCCGFYQPTIDLANAYRVDANGLPLLDTFNDTDFNNDYGINSDEPFTPDTTTPVDPRLDFTIGRRGIDYNRFGEHVGKDWIRAAFQDISGPYLPKKNVFQQDEVGQTQGTGVWGQQHSGLNYNVIRYADVLLLAAEAAVETGDLALALNYVNQVRQRAADMTPIMAIDGSGPAANYQVGLYPSFADANFARQAVRFERRLELAMEGHRFFDLARWGVITDVMNEYVQNEARTITNISGKFGTFNNNFSIMPIPIGAIDVSGGVLQQNPGY